MTDIEKLVALLSSRWSEMTSGDHIAARELAARVAEELTWLESVNATLRERVEYLEAVDNARVTACLMTLSTADLAKVTKKTGDLLGPPAEGEE